MEKAATGSMGAPLVSVVVPAFNAEQTIEETLQSVASQTYDRIEILVIDDGSTDRTAEIADSFCVSDSRFHRVSLQENAGVAIARNKGIEIAMGDWVAPIDADDIWHPQHLELLLDALQDCNDDVALASAAFRRIDMDGKVLFSALPWSTRGAALRQMMYVNLVGNGSGMIVRRKAAIEVQGYDHTLRELGSGGCEDLLLQLNIAARYPILVTPHFTVGYRHVPGAMSCDREKMVRSAELCASIFQKKHRNTYIPKRVHRWKSAGRSLVLARFRLSRGRPVSALSHLTLSLMRDPLVVTVSVLNIIVKRLHNAKRRLVGDTDVGPIDFSLMDPKVGVEQPKANGIWSERWLASVHIRRMRKLSRADQANSNILTHEGKTGQKTPNELVSKA